MKTDNELIAEFMGAERREGPRAFNPYQTVVQWIIKGNPYNQHRDDIKHWYQPVELKYHESWDWLMPVVEKIYRMPDKDIRFKLENSRCRLWYGHKLFKCHTISQINSVYAVVVEFIKWYNQQKA